MAGTPDFPDPEMPSRPDPTEITDEEWERTDTTLRSLPDTAGAAVDGAMGLGNALKSAAEGGGEILGAIAESGGEAVGAAADGCGSCSCAVATFFLLAASAGTAFAVTWIR